MVENQPPENSSLADQLYNFAWIGDIAGMTKLLTGGLDPNIPSNGEFALAKAAWQQQEQAVRLLLSYKADPNIQAGKSLHAPLHKAASRGNLPIVRALIEAHANVHLKNKYNNTALHEAAYEGRLDVVKVLVAAGASVFEKNWKGMSPSEFALSNNHPETAAYLQSIEKTLLQRQASKPTTKPQK